MARKTKRRPNYSKHRSSRKKASESDSKNKNDLTRPPVEPSPISIDKGKLREQALERAKKDLFEKEFQLFQKKTNKDYELIINTEALERRLR